MKLPILILCLVCLCGCDKHDDSKKFTLTQMEYAYYCGGKDATHVDADSLLGKFKNQEQEIFQLNILRDRFMLSLTNN